MGSELDHISVEIRPLAVLRVQHALLVLLSGPFTGAGVYALVADFAGTTAAMRILIVCLTLLGGYTFVHALSVALYDRVIVSHHNISIVRFLRAAQVIAFRDLTHAELTNRNMLSKSVVLSNNDSVVACITEQNADVDRLSVVLRERIGIETTDRISESRKKGIGHELSVGLVLPFVLDVLYVAIVSAGSRAELDFAETVIDVIKQPVIRSFALRLFPLALALWIWRVKGRTTMAIGIAVNRALVFTIGFL